MMRAKCIVIFRIRQLKVTDNFTITSSAIFILVENIPLLYRMYFENGHIVLSVLAGCMHLFNFKTYIVARSCRCKLIDAFPSWQGHHFVACLCRASFAARF